MADSILTSVKKILGIDESYTAFDLDVITHINTVFSNLHQMGVGPVDGFMIEDASAVWGDFLGTDPTLNMVKSYVYLRVRMIFDLPSQYHLVAAFENQIKELEWRISVWRESKEWVDPTPVDVHEDPHKDRVVVDGGTF